MKKPQPSRLFIGAALAAVALLVAAIAGKIVCAGRSDLGTLRRLPDGSTLKLDRAVFTATNFNYSYQSGGRLLRLIAPILPASLRGRFNLSGGSFGFGGDGNTNLLVATINRGTKAGTYFGSPLGRLQVLDELDDQYDACWGANTLAFQDETVHGWQIRAFPRRSRMITLRFLAKTPAGGWTNAADFRIRNPAFADYPQLTAEPWPATKNNGDLAVTLREFESGQRMTGRRGLGDDEAAARKTRLVFSFVENGQPSADWRVQKLTISDATGNRWSPYLDFVKQDFDWATNGTIEFFGALWPSERARKLNLEVVRTGGFKPEDLWEVPIELPRPGTLANLTDLWACDGVRVKLVAVASPNTDHIGPFKWVAKWWGEEKNRVCSLAVQLEGDLKGRRLSVVKMSDQSGAAVKLMQHGSQDYPQQAVFFRPDDGARTVRLTFALQRRSTAIQQVGNLRYVPELTWF